MRTGIMREVKAGFDTCEWIKHKGVKSVVNKTFILKSDFPGGYLQAGQYSFPFNILLPQDLPPSMSVLVHDEINKQHSGIGISYKFRAEFAPPVKLGSTESANRQTMPGELVVETPIVITNPIE